MFDVRAHLPVPETAVGVPVRVRVPVPVRAPSVRSERRPSRRSGHPPTIHLRWSDRLRFFRRLCRHLRLHPIDKY